MPLELQFEQLRFRKREREGGRRRETLRERCSEREREIEGQKILRYTETEENDITQGR